MLVSETAAARAQRAGASAGAAADSLLAGSWEGEFEGTRAPVFLTLHLAAGDTGWTGSVDVLGRSLPLRTVEPAADGVRAILAPGENGVFIEATIAGDRLTGVLVERGTRFPLALARVPDYPKPADRVEAWGQDLDALVSRFLRADRSFSPAQRALFREHVDETRRRLRELEDAEVIMRMAEAVALSGNAHTRLYLLRNRTELRRLPVRVWWFDDGLYIVRATDAHRDLLGCRVDAIAGVPARRARDRVAAAFAGNPSWTDYKSVYFLTSPEALRGFGIADDMERIPFTLSQCRDEAFDAPLAPLPIARSTRPLEAWWDLSPTRDEPGWSHALADAGRPPLYLRDTDRYYWFQRLPDSGILYVQQNRASQMDDDPIDAFGERLLAALDSIRPAALVLDLRFNTGGNLGLARELMDRLETRTRGIPRFVIIGRATFSAGMSHVAQWKAAGDVTLVGEEIGDGLRYWSEGGNIILPNSGLAAHFANAMPTTASAPAPPLSPASSTSTRRRSGPTCRRAWTGETTRTVATPPWKPCWPRYDARAAGRNARSRRPTRAGETIAAAVALHARRPPAPRRTSRCGR